MIRSHPDIKLSEHISQVRQAMDGIWGWHSEEVASLWARRLGYLLAALHDVGKGSAAFQEYIINPHEYAGDPMDKAHTPLSSMMALLLARKEGWDALEAMMLAAAIFGHHHGLPSVEKLREIGGGLTAQYIKRQVGTVDWVAIEESCRLPVSRVEVDGRTWAVAQRYLDDSILPEFAELPIEQAVDLRLKTQLLFSVLLEADKAFLAIENPEIYLKKKRRCWESSWVDERLGGRADGGINSLRRRARDRVLGSISSDADERLFSLTAPTGVGKTLLAASWALKKRETAFDQLGTYPKIIVVLPFLSIIDQTSREYEALLEVDGKELDGSWFLTSHSLSERQYAVNMEASVERFFIDTWRTELVITTYDQFLMSLFDPRARYQMRFHNLCDALIILDEVQSLPCKLWTPLAAALKSLVQIGNSQVLLMSATLPSFISNTKPLLDDYIDYFKYFHRYQLVLRLDETIHIESFCKEMSERLQAWLEERKRILIVLNTRQSARLVRDALEAGWRPESQDIPLLFITADVTPRDRMDAIDTIKRGEPCVVVSTQCIEAGIDIDMDLVIRDFGPLDSLIQIAGRCNREWLNPEPAAVEIVDLVSAKGRRFSEMIYDDVHLAVTRQVLGEYPIIQEPEILEFAKGYFDRLSKAKDKGDIHLERFARWEDDVTVRELLRGKGREEYTFLVLEQDPELKVHMAEASQINDRWERREAWRKLAARIARISVTIYPKRGFDPQDIATEYLGNWLLKPGFYDVKKGLVIKESLDEVSLIL